MIGTPRLRVSEEFERSTNRHSKDDRRRAYNALERFVANPALPGLNFEPIEGEVNRFTIRASRAIRIVRRRGRDDEGVVYVAMMAGSHTVYRRR
jgi:hypothetical protein